MVLVLAEPTYSTCTSRSQSDSALEFFLKRDMENTVRLIDNSITSGEHRRRVCLDLMFYRCDPGIRTAKEKVESVNMN